MKKSKKKTSIFLKLIFEHIDIILSGTGKETVLKGIVDVIKSDPTFKRVACLVHTSVPFKTLSEQQSEDIFKVLNCENFLLFLLLQKIEKNRSHFYRNRLLRASASTSTFSPCIRINWTLIKTKLKKTSVKLFSIVLSILLLKSIGSRLWLPGSGSAKICRSRGKISTKTANTIKIVLIYEWFYQVVA